MRPAEVACQCNFMARIDSHLLAADTFATLPLLGASPANPHRSYQVREIIHPHKACGRLHMPLRIAAPCMNG